jgi:hypothetical protein
MKHRFLYIMALLLTLATGAWAQDPDPIDLTPSADGKTWTLAATPAFDLELEVEYETALALSETKTSRTKNKSTLNQSFGDGANKECFVPEFVCQRQCMLFHVDD